MKRIKKMLAIFLTFAICASSIPFSGRVAKAASTWGYDDLTREEGGNEAAYTQYMEEDGRLFNLYSKIKDLKKGDALQVAYVGGSITNGSGASNLDTKSWRGLVGQKLTDLVQAAHPEETVENRVLYTIDREQYGDTEADRILVKNINAAFGATSSYFGVHRVYEDAGLAYSPDVVFLEFTLNDNEGGDTKYRQYTDTTNNKKVIASAADYESIIRQIYKYVPDCEIVALFTAGVSQKDGITEDTYLELSAERAVLRKYNIPYLYVGRDMVQAAMALDANVSSLTSSNCTANAAWMTYYMDTVHPNDTGHAFYADMVNSFIDEKMADAEVYETAGNQIVIDNHDGILNSSYFDASVLKDSPHQIRFGELYTGHEEMLSGWEWYSTEGSTIANQCAREGTLCTRFVGASMAFRFTGDSVGMWWAYSLSGGTATAKIYTVTGAGASETKTLYKEVSRSVGNKANEFLPSMWELAGQMPYATYEVEISIEQGDMGSSANFCRLFWNGEDTVEPVMHPDIPLIEEYADIEILPNLTSPNERYNYTITQDAETDSYVFTHSGKVNDSTDDIRGVQWDMSGKNADLRNYQYLTFEYYIDEGSTYPFDSITMQIRSTSSMGASTNLVSKNYTISGLEKGKWVTATMDLSDYLDASASAGATADSFYKRMEFYPFGADVNCNTEGMSGASIRYRSIRFVNNNSTEEPADQGVTVYVNVSGLVTLPDLTEHTAYTNFADAFDALGTEGGTILFQGAFDSFADGTKAHGDVTVKGIGDSDILRTQNQLQVQPSNTEALAIKNGNVTFENMSISYESAVGEYWIQTHGYTLTIGENVATIPGNSGGGNKYPHLASSGASGSVTSASNFVLESAGAKYSAVASMAGYAGIGRTYTGHVNYEFKDGYFMEVYGGARNSYSTADAAHKGYGDVTYTFSGGTYANAIYTGSYRNGCRFGNVIFYVNGGTFSNDIFFGNDRTDTLATHTNPGYAAIVVNCKEITETSTGTMASAVRNVGALGAGGNAAAHNIVILNHAELASDANVQIAEGTIADYQISVLNGKATPVFEASSTATTSTSAGALLGFRLEAETSGEVPCANGELLTANADGLYTIPSGEVEITFVGEAVVYLDGTNGLDTNDGATSTTAFASLKQAMLALQSLQASNKKIVIVNGYTFKGWSENDYTTHSDKITITGETTDTKLTVSGNAFIQGGPLTLEGITIVYEKDTQGGMYALGNELTIGEGVTVQSADPTNKPNLSQFTPYLGTSSHYGSGKSGASTQGTHKLTLSGGRFYEVFLSDNYLPTANDNSSIPGVDFVMNEGSTVVMLSIGGTGLGKNVYTDNVNLTFNGGNLTSQLTLANGFATPNSKLDFGGNAVQLIYNYGIIPKFGKNFTVENIEASNGLLYQMNCANVAGSSLAMTTQTGRYAVEGALLAVAVNQADASKVYVSENGILQVEEAGVYDVVFQKNAAYLNLGTKILVNEDCVIDLSQEEAAKQNGKIFVGWSGAEQVNGNTQASFTAGTELTAQYVSYDPESDFTPMGMQVLKVSDVQTDKESLRFCTQVSDALLAQLQDASYVGIVYQNVTSLGAEELTVESAGATMLDGVQLVEELSTGKLYGTEISNLDMKNSRDIYEVKAYLRYTDSNGFERVHYADCVRGSVSEVAEQVLNTVSDASAEEKAYFTEVCEYVGTPIKVIFPSQAPYTKKTESGDCTYIEFPNGENMLIDASTTDGGAAVLKELQKLRVDHIDYFVATHMHRDHVQGFAKIVEQISVGKVITTGYNQNSADAYKAFLTLVEENGYETITVRQGDTLAIGGATFDFLWPEADAADVSSDASYSQQETDSNLKSMVFRMSYGEFSALFTADVFTQTEVALIEKYGEALESTVLKIAHHGEDGSTCKSLLSAVQPKLAVTMGRTNVWAVQQRCADQGVPVYGPYADGTVTIESDGTKSWITCEKGKKEVGASVTQTSVAGQMELTIFEQSPYTKDVGTGDCTYVEFANGKNMLIGATSTAGASAVLEALQAKNVTSIDYFVATDLHQNHTGGFSTIAAQIPVGRVLMAASGKTSTDANQEFLSYVEEQAIPVQYVDRSDALILDEAELEILWVQEDQLVVRLSYRDFSALFAGDIVKTTEDALIQAYGQTLESTIFKIPYYSTDLAVSDTLVNYVNPKVAVKMCKGFDAPWDLQKRFSNRQVPVYEPFYDGTIVIQTDGSQTEVSSDKGIRTFAG